MDTGVVPVVYKRDVLELVSGTDVKVELLVELLVEPLVELLDELLVGVVTSSKHAFIETLNFISSAEGFFTTSSNISTASGIPGKRTMLSGDSFCKINQFNKL